MKTYYLIVLTILIFVINVQAQHFIYKIGYNFDTTETIITNGISAFETVSSKVIRINPDSGTKDIIFDSLDVDTDLSVDEDNNLLLLGGPQDWRFYNLPGLSLRASSLSAADCINDHFLFSSTENKSWFLSCPSDNSKYELFSVDLNSGNRTNLLDISPNAYLDSDIFFSEDKRMIYFSIADTSSIPPRTNADKIVYFSTLTNNIIEEKYLSELGFPNADAYIFFTGGNGKGIIKSIFYNEDHTSYFNIYDFDADSGSSFIQSDGYSDAYLTRNGKFLIVAQDSVDSGNKVNTGSLDLYSVLTTQLVKSFNLPSGGMVYAFRNDTNHIYYVLDPDSPGAQTEVYNLTKLLHSIDK